MGTDVISIGRIDRFESIGTFDFCRSCTGQQTCCTRVKRGGDIEAPLLCLDDVLAIQAGTGLPAEAFSVETSPNDSIRWMLAGENGCHFYRGGKCEIYSARPIDCRLFPFDVRENKEGELVLIVYSSLCPVGFDAAQYVGHAKNLLTHLGPDIWAYARAPVPGMLEKPHVVLGTIKEILGTSIAIP